MSADVPTSVTLTQLWIAAIPILLTALAGFIVTVRGKAEAKKSAVRIEVAVNGRLTQLIDALREKGAVEAELAGLRAEKQGYAQGHQAAKVQAEAVAEARALPPIETS